MTAFFLVALSLGLAQASPAPSVTLTREGGAFRLEAGFSADASPELVWEVLTDYDGMTGFLSSLRKSEIVRRTPQGVVIKQEGTARLLMFSRRVSLTLDVVERPPDRIEFWDVGGGEFEEYEGSWSVSQSSAPCSVTYQLFAEMKPSMVPRAAARRVLENSVRRQLEEVQKEVERRAKQPTNGR
jgi:hypothetical protein